MSKYTTELRFICEYHAGYPQSAGYDFVSDVIQKSIPKIFNFDFPIFDENYRNVLETKIIKHYYTREIAFESAGLWKLKLDTKLNEIMPYYNQLYKSELIKFNPMYDTEMNHNKTVTTEGTQSAVGGTVSNATGNSKQIVKDVTDASENKNSTLENTVAQATSQIDNGTKDNIDKYADTPQGAITDLLNDRYLTNARTIGETENKTSDISGTTETQEKDNQLTVGKVNKNGDTAITTESNATSDSTNNTEIKNTEQYLETVSGKQSGTSFSKMLKEFRETFLNIDMQIIEELADLFFTLW